MNTESHDSNLLTQLIGAENRDSDAIGNYALVRLLGEGAMGSVYLAYHRQFTNRFYALKLLKAERPDPEVIQRFQREIQLTGNLRHPNLIFAQDAGATEEGRPYLVMEYVPGIDLQKLLAVRTRVSFGDASALICQACDGVGHAHSQGIIHRDIKPSNMLVDRDGLLKVSDLGLAAIGNQQANLMATSAESILGTPHFMAPELWEDARAASIASDIYALGCTYYALIEGAPPFSHRQTTASLIRAHESEPPSFTSDAWKNVHGLVIDRINRCLDKDPYKRVASAEDLRLALLPYASTQVSVREEISEEAGRDLTTVHGRNLATEPKSSSHSARPNVDESQQNVLKVAQDSKWSINAQSKPILARVFIALTIMLAISIVSLTMAYYGPAATEAWRRRYDLLRDSHVMTGSGYIIELARTMLFLTLTTFVLAYRFGREMRALTDFQRWNWKLTLGRIAILAILATFLGMEIHRHLSVDQAATDLAKWAHEHNINTTPEKELSAFRWYLGYCLVNDLVILGGLIAFPFARFITFDADYAWRQKLILRNKIANLNAAPSVAKELFRFGSQCRELALRYVDVLATLVAGVHFDWWIGWQTLSESAFMVTAAGWIVIVLGCGFLLAITWIYARAHDDAAKRVAEVGTVSDEAEIAKINVLWFLQRTLFGSFSGLVCLTVWLVVINAFLKQ